MKKMISFRILFNLTFLNLLLSNLNNIDNGRILEAFYRNFSQDLIKISFPTDVSFTYFIFSIPTAVALSILYGSIVNIKFDSDNIQTIFRKTTLIFIINTSVTSTAIFFFRTYELLSRFYVLVFFILYPLLILFVEYLAFLLNKIEKS